MSDDTAPKRDFAAELREHMAHDDFPTLLKRFEESECPENAYKEAYAVASWMVTRYPQESKHLLPKIADNELTYGGPEKPNGTTSDWAAALTASKLLHHGSYRHDPNATESQIHDNAVKIYEYYNSPKPQSLTNVKNSGQIR